MEKKNICSEIKILSNLIRRKTFLSETLNSYVTILGSQGYILKFLNENVDTNVYQRDIERKFKVRRSTVTSAITRMEKAGLVKRQSVESDSRLKKIVLTLKGIDLHCDIEKAIKKTEEEITSALTDKEAETMYTLIKKLQQKLEE